MKNTHNHVDIIEVGWYHPSNANWSYHVHMIVDSTGARLYRETFGGDSRLIDKLEKIGIKAEKLHVGKGSSCQYRWKDIKDLHDIEDYKGRNWGEDNGMIEK